MHDAHGAQHDTHTHTQLERIIGVSKSTKPWLHMPHQPIKRYPQAHLSELSQVVRAHVGGELLITESLLPLSSCGSH